MKSPSIVAAMVALAAPSIHAQPAPAAPARALPADFKTRVDTMLAESFPSDGPGVLVLVSRGGRTDLIASRGLADVANGKPVTADTVFRYGSVAKQFTAAVILQLVAEKRLSLDDRLSRFFPGWPAPASAATIRQLLNHSSGLQDFTKVPGWVAANRTKPTSTDALVALMRSLPARSAPGATWEYNNGGYVMLGAIIEKVTGKPWYEVITERIIRPLKLDSVRAGPTAAGSADALGYTEVGGRQQPIVLSHMSVPHAAGGLVGNASDLAKWAEALHHGQVVPPALYREMTARARLNDGTSEDYGFGLRLSRFRGKAVLAHGGALAGFNSGTVFFPSEELFVAVFANSDDPAAEPNLIAQKVSALALGDPFPTLKPVSVDPASVAALVGSYIAEDGLPRRFFERAGKFFLARGEVEMQAIPAGQDRFFFGPNELTWLRFVRRPDGKHLLEVHRPDEARPRLAHRSGPVPTDADVRLEADKVAAYRGTFTTEGPRVVIAADGEGGLTVQVAGNPPLPMRPISQTEFAVDVAQARIVMHPEADGQVNRLTVKRGARQLNGRRVEGAR